QPEWAGRRNRRSRNPLPGKETRRLCRLPSGSASLALPFARPRGTKTTPGSERVQRRRNSRNSLRGRACGCRGIRQGVVIAAARDRVRHAGRPGGDAVNGYLLMLCCAADDLPVRFFASCEEAVDFACVNGPRIAELASLAAARLQR